MPPLLRKIALFGCLSLADLLLTWQLLQARQSPVYESNPVARWCLGEFGWGGLAIFKTGMVLLTCGLAVTISRRCTRTAERLMTFSCCVLAMVVLYSGSLIATGQHVEQTEIAQVPPEWADEARQNVAHLKLVDRLCEDLIAGRRTLPQAIEELADSARAKSPAWRQQLVLLYHCDSRRKCLATYLVLHTAAFCQTEHPSQLRSIARRMGSAFRADYGDVPPYVSDIIPAAMN